jgi:hypothetical protein
MVIRRLSGSEAWTAVGAIASVAGVLATAAVAFFGSGRRVSSLDAVRVDTAEALPVSTSGDRGSSRQQVSTVQNDASAVTDATNVSSTSTPSVTKPEPLMKGSSGATGASEITISEHRRALPDVIAAADDALNILQLKHYRVQGNLRWSQSQADDGLHGIITTDLTLDVRLIDTQRAVRDAFTITSRGGGFTSDSSARQARERLRDALHEHLQKEHS